MNKYIYILLFISTNAVLQAQASIFDKDIIVENLEFGVNKSVNFVTQDYYKIDSCIYYYHIIYSHSKYNSGYDGYRMRMLKLNQKDCSTLLDNETISNIKSEDYNKSEIEFELMSEDFNQNTLYDPNILFKMKLIDEFSFKSTINEYRVYPGDFSRGLQLKERVANALDIFRSPKIKLTYKKNNQIIKSEIYERTIPRKVFDEMLDMNIDEIKLTVFNKYKDELVMYFKIER